jgi:Cap4 dsDNA endonuclease
MQDVLNYYTSLKLVVGINYSMNLQKKLVNTKLREKGGSIALSRLDYQMYWGASKVIELYKTGSDFALGFEYLDDIIQVDNPTTPTKIKFFQVKTKVKNNWSAAGLVKLESGSSILGKLLENKFNFEDFCEGIHLVTNTSFNFANGRDILSFNDLDDKTKKIMIDAMKSEKSKTTDDILEGLEFWSDSLPLDHCDAVVKSKLVELVVDKFGQIPFRPIVFALSFFEECRNKSKKITEVKQFSELVKGKFITRADVEKWLKIVVTQSRSKPDLGLALSHCPASSRSSLRDNWANYELGRGDVRNVTLAALRDTVRKLIENYIPSNDQETIRDTLSNLQANLQAISKNANVVFDEGIAIASLFYEYLIGEEPDEAGRTLPKIDPQSEDQVQ